jgi:membrane-associated phospholipid phosphatase
MNKFFSISGFLFFGCIVVNAQNFDINLAKKINEKETHFKNGYAAFIADAVKPLSIATPASIGIAGIIMHNKKMQYDALFMGGSLVLNTIVTQSVKRIVNRKRPYTTYAFIVSRAHTEPNLSFPSGHTSTAFCTATDVAMRYKKWYFVAPAYAFAASVAWARMYQGVHYPTDVFTGALVGTGSAWLGYKAQQWMQHKHKKKAATKLHL